MAMLEGIGILTDVCEGVAGGIGVRAIIYIVGTINRYRDAAGNRVVKMSTRNVEVVNVGVICVRVMLVVKNVVMVISR